MSRMFRYYMMMFTCVLAVLFVSCSKREKEATQESTTPSEQQSKTSKSESPMPASGQPVSSPSVPATSPASTDSAKIAAQNAETLKVMNQGKDIEPVSTDTLKGFLPTTLAGMKRGQSDAKQMSTMGIKMASAQADYQASSGSGMLELMIMDLGNVSGPMRVGMTGWAIAQVDRQTDTGYEKTVTYQGYKGMEEYDRQDQHGEFRIFVGDHFIVEVKGDNVTMETIKQAMGQIDLKKLAQAAK